MYCRNLVFVCFCLLLALVKKSHAQSEESPTTKQWNVTTLPTVLPDSEVETISYNVEEERINNNITDTGKNITEDEKTKSEIESIFKEIDYRNSTQNYTNEFGVDLLSNKTIAQNDTIGPEARVSDQDSNNNNNNDSPAVGPAESAGILAGVVVLIGIIGFIGFVVWRRVLQYRYGNSEMLITDDVYDISDLRYFEI